MMRGVRARAGPWIAMLAFLSLLACSRKEESGYFEQIVEGKDGFTMKMGMAVSGDPDLLYGILTDFDRFPEFMPQCSSVEILAREGETVTIETKRFVKFLGKNLAGKLEYTLSPGHIAVRSIDHPLADFSEEWTLAPLEELSGTYVGYTALSKMKVPMPDYLCQAWLRDNFKETLAAVEKRALESTARPGP